MTITKLHNKPFRPLNGLCLFH